MTSAFLADRTGESDVEEEQHYFKRWIFCHYSPSVKLTQFDFYKRGRRTQEALTSYLKDVSPRLMSVFANIRNHNLDPKTYLCDVFRRIGKTAKEDLETLLAHLWAPQAVLNL